MSDLLQAERRLQLIQTVQTIVNESGDPEGFNAARWVDDWLSHPHPALGGWPADYLVSDEGCQRLVQLLRQIQASAYG